MAYAVVCRVQGMLPSKRLALRCAALALASILGAVSLSGSARACITCDSDHKCHSGDEQGAYLCRSGEMRCSLIKQLLGFECAGHFCETSVPCDNRNPSGRIPSVGTMNGSGFCMPAPSVPQAMEMEDEGSDLVP